MEKQEKAFSGNFFLVFAYWMNNVSFCPSDYEHDVVSTKSENVELKILIFKSEYQLWIISQSHE